MPVPPVPEKVTEYRLPTALAPSMIPTGLQVVPSYQADTITWFPVNPSVSSSPVTYNIYRGTASGTETLLASGLSGTSYTDSGLLGGTTTYYYYVTAVYSNLAVPPSSVATFETPPTNEASGRPSDGALVPGLTTQYFLDPIQPPGGGNYAGDASDAWLPANLVQTVNEPFVNDSDFTNNANWQSNGGSSANPNYMPTGITSTQGGANNFSVQWNGFLIVPTTGTYVFSTGSDDGSYLFVNGSLVVNNGFFQGVTYRSSGSISLSAGQVVPIEMQYYQGAGGAGAFMDWNINGAGRVVIPAANLETAPLPGPASPAQGAPSTQFGWSPEVVQAAASLQVGYPPTTVTVSMVGPGGNVTAGTTARFVVTLTNVGPNTAYHVNLQDVLPAPYNFLDQNEQMLTSGGSYVPVTAGSAYYFTPNNPAVGSNGTLTDSIYSLPANGSGNGTTTLVFNIDVTVKTNTPPGTITNTVVASGDNFKVNTTAAASLNMDPGSKTAYANYDADSLYSAASSFSTNNPVDITGITDPNPAPQGVFQTEHYSQSAFSYSFNSLSNVSGLSATPGGLYNVRLDFAELQPYGGTVGDGIFNVAINGTTVLTNFDIGAAARTKYGSAGGLYKAIDESFLTSAFGPSGVTPGNITVTLTPVGVSGTGTAYAEINGIQISPAAATPTNIINQASLTVTKTAAAAGDAAGTVDPGNNLVYTYTIANNNPAAPSDAQNVLVTFPLAPNETYVANSVTYTGPGSWTVTHPLQYSNGTITDSIADLPWGQSATFTWTVQVGTSQTSGTINNGVAPGPDTATATASDAVTSTASSTTTINNPPDNLVVTKTGPAKIQPNQNIAWTVTVTNTGNNPAFGVELKDLVPQPTTGTIKVVSDTGSPGWTIKSVPGSTTFDDVIAELLPGAGNAATFTWTAFVSANTTQGFVIKNIATGSATGNDGAGHTIGPRLAATGEQDTKVTSPPTTLTIGKTGSPGSVVAGAPGTADQVTYTITVTNTGANAAFGTVVTDPLPKGETFVSGTGPNGNWTANPSTTGGGITTVTFNDSLATDSLATGAYTFTIIAAVPASTPAGTLSNVASVTAGNLVTAGPVKSAPINTTVTNSASMKLAKSVATAGSIFAGNTVTYNLTLTTTGPSDSFGVSISDPLPKNFTVSTFNAPAGWFATTSGPTGGGITTVKFAPTAGNVNAAVAPGALGGFQIVAKVPSSTVAGSYGNIATANAGGGEASASNPVTNVKITDKAVLAITKSDTAGNVTAGNTLNYAIQLTNSGPSDAFGAQVTDKLPKFTTTTQASLVAPAGWTAAYSGGTGGNVTFTITSGDWALGSSPANFTIPATVVPGAPTGTVLSNTASGSATDASPVTSAPAVTNTVQTQSTLVVTMSAAANAAPGKNLVYTVTVQNTGPSDASSATLNVPIPKTSGGLATTFLSDTPAAGWAFGGSTGGVVKFSDADFAPGTSTFTVTVTVPLLAPNGNTITNTATAGAANSAAGGTPGTVTSNPPTVTTINNQAVLTIGLAANPTPNVPPNSNITYTITVQNTGTDAINTVVSFAIPTASDLTPLTFQGVGALPAGWSDTPLPAIGSTGGTVTFKLMDFPASASPTTFTILVGVPNTTLNGSQIGTVTFPDSAKIGADNSGPNGTPGSQTSGNVLVTVNAVANLNVKMTAAPTPNVTAGNPLTYTVTVTNTGPNNASNASLSVPIPVGVSFVSVGALPAGWTETDGLVAGATKGNLTFTDGNLGLVSSVFTVNLMVPSNAVSGSTITDKATVNASDAPAPATSGNVSVTVNTAAALTVTKSAFQFVNPGRTLTYTITVADTGPSDAQGVVLTDVLPTTGGGVTFASVGALPAGWAETDPGAGNPGTVTFSDLNPLTAGTGAVTFTIVVNVPATMPLFTTFKNTVTATETTPVGAGSQLSATASTEAAPFANLSLTKAAPGTVVPGQTFTYTVTLNDAGPNPAINAVVTDALPFGVTFSSFGALPAGWSGSVAANGLVTLSDASFGDPITGLGTANFTIVVKTSPYIFTPMPLSNTASVTANDAQLAVINSNTVNTTITPSANMQYVNAVYEKLLNRAPDPGALYWVNQLNAGMAPSTFVADIEASHEYLNDVVNNLYFRYLNRAAGPSGQMWVNQLAAGVPIANVTASILSSQEFLNDVGGSTTGYIVALYQDLLGRSPSQAEINSWLAYFNAGLVRNGASATAQTNLRYQMALTFLHSTGYEASLVNSYYQNFLYRAADIAGLNSWVQGLQAGLSDQAVLAAIFGSGEGYNKNS